MNRCGILLATAETQTQISLLQPGHTSITRCCPPCRRIPSENFRSPFHCVGLQSSHARTAAGLQLSWAMIKRTLAH